MKQALKLLFGLSIQCFAFFSSANAQESQTSSFFTSKPNSPLVNHFNQVIDLKTRLYNGKHYEFDSPTIEGNAFYGDSIQFAQGVVNYDGFRFENVPLLYDISRDLVITKTSDLFTAFVLYTNKINDFYIGAHHFVKLEASADKNVPKPGFYELAYDGKVKVLVKRTSSIQQKLGNVVQKYFLRKTAYYLIKDGKYHEISSQSSFMSLFNAEKSLFRKKLKENDLRFSQNPEESIILLVDYYQTLSN